MIIALDYDDTYTRDPVLWLEFVRRAKERGHEVVCATMRHDHEGWDMDVTLTKLVHRVVFTGRKAKQPFLRALGIEVSVWIDDTPYFVVNDAKG